MKSALIELHFLPSLEYFCALLNFESVILETHENYVKQTYRNRCYINTAHGVELLIIPLTEKHGKVLIKDVRIDYSKKWLNQHWRTIESAYRKAPFYEHYEGALRTILHKRFEFLYDLNWELLSFCLQNISLRLKLTESLSYEKKTGADVGDLRSVIIPKKSYSDRGFYISRPYYQIFGSKFVPNLSLVDLLFCAGPDAKSHLQDSMGKLNK